MPDLRNLDISEIAELKNRIKTAEQKIRKQLQKQEEEEQLRQTEEFYKKKFGKQEPPKTTIEDAEEV